MSVRQALAQRFPGMEVVGSQYPVAPYKAVLSKVVTVAQLGGIGIMLGGEQLFAALGLEAPQLYHQYKEKKFGVIMGCWFLGNALQNQLLATGTHPPSNIPAYRLLLGE